MEKSVNCLGLDKYQTAIIKRNYQTLKPLLNKRDKAIERREEAIKKAEMKYKEEYDIFSIQIDAFDNITKEYTRKSCGYELTSEQCMEFIKNPDLFEEFKRTVQLTSEAASNNTEIK